MLRRPVRCLLYPALALALFGCRHLHRSQPVTVTARDADTGEPIAGADVRVTYLMTRSPFAPVDDSGTAGRDGVAHVHAVPYGDSGVTVAVSAKGYLPEEQFLSVKTLSSAGKEPTSLVVAMHAGPSPTVELVLPAGYRGLVKVEMDPRQDAPCQPKQRHFRCEVPASGIVRVTGPALLRRVDAPDITARFADGTPLVRDAKDEEVGFWYMGTSASSYTFLVATRTEHTLFRQGMWAGGGKRGG